MLVTVKIIERKDHRTGKIHIFDYCISLLNIPGLRFLRIRIAVSVPIPFFYRFSVAGNNDRFLWIRFFDCCNLQSEFFQIDIGKTDRTDIRSRRFIILAAPRYKIGQSIIN